MFDAFTPKTVEPEDSSHLASLKDMRVLTIIRTIIAEDKKAFAFNPVASQLIARYEDILNNIDTTGLPRAPIEPAKEFRDRVNELLVSTIEKRAIKKRKYAAKQASKQIEKFIKADGKAKYERSFNAKRNG